MKIWFLEADTNNKDLYIYDKFGNFTQFVDENDLTDVSSSVVNRVSQVKAHSRQPYMRSKSSSQVDAHERKFIVDTGRRKGNALPGKNFTLAGTISGKEELRTFTYVGRMMDLHSYIYGHANVDLVLYSSSGARYSDIPESTKDEPG